MTAVASPKAPFVHPTAVVDPGAVLDEDVHVWHFCHVMPEARIGRGAMLGQGCFVGRGVSIGERSRIQNHVNVFEGVEIGDDVFVGPGAVFTNVRNPRAFVKREFERTILRRGATIGANATILCGVEIGEYAFVGAATLVRTNVPAHALVVGVPARRVGWVSTRGERLVFTGDGARCPVTGERYRLTPNGVVREEPSA